MIWIDTSSADAPKALITDEDLPQVNKTKEPFIDTVGGEINHFW